MYVYVLLVCLPNACTHWHANTHTLMVQVMLDLKPTKETPYLTGSDLTSHHHNHRYMYVDICNSSKSWEESNSDCSTTCLFLSNLLSISLPCPFVSDLKFNLPHSSIIMNFTQNHLNIIHNPSVQGLSPWQLDTLVENSGWVNYDHSLEARKGQCSLVFVTTYLFSSLSPTSSNLCSHLIVWPSRIIFLLSLHSTFLSLFLTQVYLAL